MLTLSEIIFISPIQNYTRPDYDHIPLTYGNVPGLKLFIMSQRSENVFSFFFFNGYSGFQARYSAPYPLLPLPAPLPPLGKDSYLTR